MCVLRALKKKQRYLKFVKDRNAKLDGGRGALSAMERKVLDVSLAAAEREIQEQLDKVKRRVVNADLRQTTDQSEPQPTKPKRDRTSTKRIRDPASWANPKLLEVVDDASTPSKRYNRCQQTHVEKYHHTIDCVGPVVDGE